MKILFASSEVAPFAKVGGLGDVSAALPRKLAEMGHDVRLVMPYYGRVQKGRYAISEALPDVRFKMGPHDVRVGFLKGTLPDSDVPVYFVRCGSLFDRESVYGAGPEEALRFGVLNWAALALCQQLRFAPDVVHVNDWQTSLIPVMLRSVFAWDRLFARTRTVLTIHNMGHQGTFEAQTVAEVGLGSAAHLVHQDALREGRFGFLQTGLLHANAVTTVSPTYAPTCCSASSTASTSTSGTRPPTRTCPRASPRTTCAARRSARRACKPRSACPRLRPCPWPALSRGWCGRRDLTS